MKRLLHYKLLLLFLLASPTVLAQWQNGLWTGKQANNWHFGFAAGINFNSAPPQALTDSAMEPDLYLPDDPSSNASGIEGTGSVSDEFGNLLFYTNGVSVWNKNNIKMPNGAGLNGNASSTQSGLIVPMPGNPDLYYIFSIDCSVFSPTLAYSIVDMTLNGGLGDVTDVKNIQLTDDVQEKISAVYHTDKEKIWVIVSSNTTNGFKAFLISDEGINTTAITSNIGVGQEYSGIGQMKFSPNGKLLAKSGLSAGQFYVEVFNFDDETGLVQDIVTTFNSTDFPGELLGCYGIEFSPDSTILYAASVFTAKVFQFNLLAGTEQDIKNSGTVIGQDTEFSNFSMQLAPDGKIYLARGNFGAPYDPYLGTQSTINVINYPNNLGTASGFTQQAIDLVDGRNDLSLPGFIQSYFASGIVYEGKCASEEIVFSTLRIPDVTTISWNFGDPASGEENISSEGHHIFSSAGTYVVIATITSNDVQQTATVEVTILPAPIAAVPTVGLAKCGDSSGNVVFDLTEFDNTILSGQDASEFSVLYFASQEDLESNTPITAPNVFSTTGQTIYARVSNGSTGCFETIQFELIVNPLPVASKPENIQECESSNKEGVFNLTSQNSFILGDQEGFEVVYYSDEVQAQQGENPITDEDNFSSIGQTIYAVVTNPVTGCRTMTEFDLIVVNAPVLVDGFEFTGCVPFDLEIITAEVGTGLTLKFYITEEDALNQTNVINNPSQYAFSGNEVTLYVLAENQNGCTAITQLQLYKDGCEIQKGISPNGDGMNEEFDLSGLMVSELQIFNRYGKKVYEYRNYTNEWKGQSDKGDELPDGTYYYVIMFASGEPSKTGWIYINK